MPSQPGEEVFAFDGRGAREHWVSVDGARLRYLSCGSGPPLLLLHGLLGYSFSWRFNYAALASHATLYAPDLPGVGFSDRPRGGDCSLRATAAQVLRFLDAVGVERCHLLGTSRGGALAMMVAALSAEQGGGRVRRLVLVAPMNPWSAPGRWLARLLATRVASALLPSLASHLRFTHGFWLRRMYGDTRRVRQGTLQGYSAPLAIPGTFQHLLCVLGSWQADLKDLESVLPSIAHIPTLLIWGSRDSAVSPSSAAKLRRQFSYCELVILQGAGHLPYEEVPEEFNRAVADFLAAPGSTDSSSAESTARHLDDQGDASSTGASLQNHNRG